MLTDKCAAKFFSKMYHDVWANYSTKELHNYYSTDLVSRSGQHEFCYEELHTLLEVNPNRFSFMTPEIHRVKAVADDALTAWFTTWHYGHDDKVAMRIDTMTNYKIKDDKVISVDFMWDQPIDLVMGYATQHSLNVLNKMLPYEMQKLTLRELQCFFHIIQAKSAKQIAQLVEYYASYGCIVNGDGLK
jgi:hypothetical protein